LNVNHVDYTEEAHPSQPAQAVCPTDPITVAIQIIFQANLTNLREQEAACYNDRVIESMRLLHRAAEKLQTTVALADPYLSNKQAKRFNKCLHKLARKINGVRELDIIMHNLLVEGEGSSNRRAIAGILAHMDAQRLLAKEALYGYLEGRKYRQVINQLDALHQAPVDEAFKGDGLSPGQPQQVRHVLPLRIHEQLAQVRAYTPLIADANADTLTGLHHHVRHLHDLCAAFRDVLGSELDDYLQSLDNVLADLDRIAEMTGTLDRLIHLPHTSLNTEQLTLLKGFRESLRERREGLIEQFPARWAAFDQRTTHKALSDALCALY
jgi:hypothetical protein